jgi:hypothetical protein
LKKKKKNKRKRSQKREAPGTYFLLRRNTKGHIEFMNVGSELPVYLEPTRLVKATPEFCRPPTPWPTADMAKIMVSVKAMYETDEDGVPLFGKSKEV